ncbi:MAG TPA: glutaminyl-peptide cyclotransferase [Pyrinomonadaceae bacterium]|nr:glutaminyl-peptide cyclotransferase [Pyrinomonadaceae bacterium]
MAVFVKNHQKWVLLLAVGLSLSRVACQNGTTGGLTSQKSPEQSVVSYGYEVVRVFPHDRDAFTQGLIFTQGNLLESTGEVGRSSLRRLELETGKPVQKIDVPAPYFAEGLTLFKGKLYQLTWQHQLGFIYDAATFEQLGTFKYQGEGWGLTNDGQSLIISDGTNELHFLNPDNFQVTKTLAVTDRRRPVMEINELEYVKGEIFANIWHGDRIARINPDSGAVLGWIDLAGILPNGEVSDQEAVLNGIAYDEAGDRLFVTGKLWPRLFEIRLLRR